MTSRRLFLKNSGLALFAAGTAPLWLQRAAAASSTSSKKVLVAIFQRGAVDGLNMVSPSAIAPTPGCGRTSLSRPQAPAKTPLSISTDSSASIPLSRR
ncbi:MAG: hypothetical protein WDO18_09925 [Acidobacteriota bacterium]